MKFMSFVQAIGAAITLGFCTFNIIRLITGSHNAVITVCFAIMAIISTYVLWYSVKEIKGKEDDYGN